MREREKGIEREREAQRGKERNEFVEIDQMEIF